MVWFLTRRVSGTIPVILLISLLVFLLLHAAPGDPAILLVPEEATPSDIERIRRDLGLDQPIYIQYLKFVAAAVTGDFGKSFRFGEPVARLIADHLPATLELALVSTVFAVLIGVPFGIWAGARPNSWLDNAASLIGFFGISMPNFWMGIMLILIMAGYFNLLPTSGREAFGAGTPQITGFILLDTLLRGDVAAFGNALRHMVLPAVTLGTNMIGIIMRVTRSSVLEIMHEDYVTTARAKGQSERLVLWRHVLKNALIVIITVVGLELGTLLSGSIIVETVFVWPGMGSLLIEGLQSRDYPLIIGLVLVYTTMFVIINVAIDICYAVIDPRIRFD
jgi:ABC-type dipeptide/oligopeptide/nickel transport system permease component